MVDYTKLKTGLYEPKITKIETLLVKLEHAKDKKHKVLKNKDIASVKSPNCLFSLIRSTNYEFSFLIRSYSYLKLYLFSHGKIIQLVICKLNFLFLLLSEFPLTLLN
jgi:hypothetical protein